MKRTLYTAVGRFERRSNDCGLFCPVIVISGRTYMVDLQEMVVWTCLNWRICRKAEIGDYYAQIGAASALAVSRSWEACVDRLVLRGLLIQGEGETEYDALYDLLSSMYIIPVEGSFLLRFRSFLKLLFFRKVPFSAARHLLQKDRRSASEEQVMKLAKQALLSTAEIISCMEKGIDSLPDEKSILDGLYSDDETTSGNIGYLVRSNPQSQPVILAVANLYLRRQIIFERV